MPVHIPTKGDRSRRSPERWDGPQRVGTLLAALGMVAAAILVWTLPAALVLPALSVLVIVAAGTVGAMGWLQSARARTDRITYWDLAGALTLIGACAALLSDAEQVMPILEVRRSL